MMDLVEMVGLMDDRKDYQYHHIAEEQLSQLD